MIRIRRSPHLAPGSAFLAGVLLVLLGLSAVLAYQAADAARSEALSTDRALRGYASVATWELARRADAVARERLAAALARSLSARADSPAVLLRRARREMAWCGCSPTGAFRYVTHGDGVAASSTPMDSALDDALARSDGLARSKSPASSPDSVRVDLLTVAARRYLVAHAGDDTLSAGFVVDADSVAAAAFDAGYRSAALLPRSVGGRAAPDDVVTASVTRADGTALWRSSPATSGARDRWVDAKVGAYAPDPLARGAVTEPLGGLFDGLSTVVAVNAGAAGVPASAPGSRLPLLLTVFGLTLGLVAVAIVQLRRQQELVRLRDDFVSGVSHELRTPLAQIRLFAELLESGRLASGEQRSRSVRIINEESRRLSWLVENILHFSRAQRGAGRVHPQPVQGAPLVREIVDSFAPLARARDVTFHVSADEGVLVRADADALRQVLLNLLDNAVKYGPAGQTVQVRAELRGIAFRITVDDRGPGVPWEERARVWEPYRRLARHAEDATGGSGIGLAVVKDLVELHGGRVGVGEAPGGGARVWIELPYAMHAGPSPHAEPAALPAEPATR